MLFGFTTNRKIRSTEVQEEFFRNCLRKQCFTLMLAGPDLRQGNRPPATTSC
jgi:hypothetical protein